ncbi:UDP-N-acetylglucosamine 2-epimerase [Paenibacillus oryzisoli]|uniref:UDP-N-acetyl-D-glucosamine 2-epimerase, UDP-hydrolysing n=1 Tax=Paenibacillus oryzisoli TaxID=1850517 RepID=A0A198A087_9BACL|nr:UDP-N-acetylglucosamine 2-epimerase [Paenibacillus oryzisoli]OAS14517.1 UDP-N-acetyl-D-glucosamine 2-epimerase, UDP-hydrolysing [Paenibacillus oryzisoli]
MSKRKICVVTGTRAEYGLLYWILRELQQDESIDLQIVATGMHLSQEFGLTYKQIENDGFIINEKVEMLLSSDTPVGIAKSVGLGTISFAETLQRLNPNIIVVLGDRFEIFSAVQSAMILRIPIAHIHGGELTEGLIDEGLRHSITKMSQIHFVATEAYRRRVIQLGEQPDNVFNFGAPGLDYIGNLNLLSKEELQESIGIRFNEQTFLVTYHPVTLEENTSEEHVKELLAALDYFPNASIIFTKSNSDTNGRIINQLLGEYVENNKGRCKIFASLGQKRYLSAIKHCDVVIGNSSSGLIEVPAFKKPTVNIGDRQKGRIKTASVIDCDDQATEIKNSIQKALTKDFNSQLLNMRSEYGGHGNTSKQIAQILKTIQLDGIVKKTFYDVDVNV